jgi:hypothetical protein
MYEWCAVVIIFWIVWGFLLGYAIMAREYIISSGQQVREMKRSQGLTYPMRQTETIQMTMKGRYHR